MSKRTYLALITEEGKATKMEELEEEGKATTMKDAKAQRKAKQMEVKALAEQEGPKRVYRPKWADTAEIIVRLGPKSKTVTCLIGDTWEDIKWQACEKFNIDDPDKYDIFCALDLNTIGVGVVSRFVSFNAVCVGVVSVLAVRFVLVASHFFWLGGVCACVSKSSECRRFVLRVFVAVAALRLGWGVWGVV